MNLPEGIEASVKDCNISCDSSLTSYNCSGNDNKSCDDYDCQTIEKSLNFGPLNQISISSSHTRLSNDTKITGLLKESVTNDHECFEDDDDPLVDYRNSVWKKRSTKLLLSLCNEYKSEFCDYTKKKKYIWETIAEKLRQHGYSVTADSCDTKWRNMLKTYRKTVKYNEQSNVPRKCPFFDEIDAVLSEQRSNKQVKESLQNKKENYGCLMQKRIGVTWNTDSIMYLISAFREHKKDFNDDRIKKKYVWNKIAETMNQKGFIIPSDSCEAKWKNLIRKFRQTLDDSCKPTIETHRSPIFREIVDVFKESYCSIEQKIDLNESPILSNKFLEQRKPVGFIWDLQSTKLLITLYAENKIKNSSWQKKSKLWTNVAQTMCDKGYSVTANRCDAKWRKMIKIFKSALQYHKRTGNVPTKCWYFEEMKEFCGFLSANTKSIKHLKGIHKKKIQKSVTKKQAMQTQFPDDDKKTDIISWLDSRKEEQNRREKEKIEVLMNMHKERMELMSALIQVLKK